MNKESDLNETPEEVGNSEKVTNLEMDPLIKEKMKKNLVYVSIFSIVMLFAGLTSAYIVSMGDSFWIKFPLPISFWISTAVIVLSSVFIQLGITFAKKNNQKLSKLFVVLTFVFGLLFVYFQYKGYGQLVDSGSHLRGEIMVVDGRYGSIGDDGRYYGYYEIKYNGKFLEIDGNDYLVDQKKLTSAQFSELKEFTLNSELSKIRLFHPSGNLYFTRADNLKIHNSLFSNFTIPLRSNNGFEEIDIDDEKDFALAKILASKFSSNC